MDGLRWSDNICTVGWTNIWAWMTADEMAQLKGECPQGYFTPTFPPPWSNFATLTPELMRAHFGEAARGFYFTFPEDKAGQRLLVRLRLMGMQGERYMSANTAWVERRRKWLE